LLAALAVALWHIVKNSLCAALAVGDEDADCCVYVCHSFQMAAKLLAAFCGHKAPSKRCQHNTPA